MAIQHIPSNKKVAAINFFVFWGLVCVIAACGDDSGSSSSQNVDTADSDIFVATYDDLPVCSSKREGTTAYVKDEKVAYACENGGWVPDDKSSSGSESQKDSLSSDLLPEVSIENKTITGVSQKGPFVKGSTVTAYELDGSKSLLQTGRTFSGTITQDDGKFNLSNVTLKSSYVKLSASGYYRNEVTGNKSTSTITLNAVTDLDARNTVNVNLLTHLEYDRVAYLMAHGDGTLKIKDLKKKAEKEIFEAFHIKSDGFGYSEDLDVLGSTEADAALLAISILLQGDRTEAELTELLMEISDDLSVDGSWDDEETKVAIADYAIAQNLSKVRKNVEKWGLSTSVPKFEKYIDSFVQGTYSIDSCDEKNGGNTVILINNNSRSKYSGRWIFSCIEKTLYRAQGYPYVVGGVEYGIITDSRDNTVYPSIKLNGYTIMATNLNFDYEINGSPYGIKESEEYDPVLYGKYYTWVAAVDSAGIYSTDASGCGYMEEECSVNGPVRGICPEGSHIPDSTEWVLLYRAMGSSPYALQATGYEEWPNATGVSGFAAAPIGSYYGKDTVYKLDVIDRIREPYAAFWGAKSRLISAECIIVTEKETYIGSYFRDIHECFMLDSMPVRCVKD